MSDVVDAGTIAPAPADVAMPAPTEMPPTPASPASDPQPAETPVAPEPPALAPEPVETPVIETPQEVPEVEMPEAPESEPKPTQSQTAPAQASPEVPQAPAAHAAVSIKDRLAQALEKIRFNKRKKLDKIVALAQEKRSITNDDVQIAVRVSHNTATNYLNALVIAGRLRRVGSAAHAIYEPV